MNIKKLEPYLDLYDFIAVLSTEESVHTLRIYKRLLKSYVCVEIHKDIVLEEITSGVRLFSKDQKIPLIHHINSSQIKEKVIRLEDVDEDDIEEEINRLKPSLFGLNRLKQGRVECKQLSQTEQTKLLKLTYIPDRLTFGFNLKHPFLLLTTYYNGITISKISGLDILQHEQTFYVSLIKNEKTVHQCALVNTNAHTEETVLEVINRLLGMVQEDNKEPLPEKIRLHSFRHVPKIERFSVVKEPSDYFESLLSSIDLESIETKGSAYLVKQRVLKSVLFAGLSFLVLFFSTKIIEGVLGVASNYYASEITNLSKELYEIERKQQQISTKEKKLKEIRQLASNRSFYSHKIHTIAAFFTNKLWLKKLHSEKENTFIIEGFALTAKEVDRFLARVGKQEGLTIKPLSQELLSYKELKREKLTSYRTLIRFQFEVIY